MNGSGVQIQSTVLLIWTWKGCFMWANISLLSRKDAAFPSQAPCSVSSSWSSWQQQVVLPTPLLEGVVGQGDQCYWFWSCFQAWVLHLILMVCVQKQILLPAMLAAICNNPPILRTASTIIPISSISFLLLCCHSLSIWFPKGFLFIIFLLFLYIAFFCLFIYCWFPGCIPVQLGTFWLCKLHTSLCALLLASQAGPYFL